MTAGLLGALTCRMSAWYHNSLERTHHKCTFSYYLYYSTVTSCCFSSSVTDHICSIDHPHQILTPMNLRVHHPLRLRSPSCSSSLAPASHSQPRTQNKQLRLTRTLVATITHYCLTDRREHTPHEHDEEHGSRATSTSGARRHYPAPGWRRVPGRRKKALVLAPAEDVIVPHWHTGAGIKHSII
jgi:hypothetical protein